MENIVDLLRCPISKGPLELKGASLYSPSSNVNFESVSGIPWFFKHSQVVRLQWNARAQQTLAYYKSQVSYLSSLNQTDQTLRASTRKRLQKLQQGYETQLQHLQALLAPFLSSTPDFSAIDCMAEKVPKTQHVDSYFTNVLRDWCWSTQENTQNLNQFKELVGNRDLGITAVLGAGSCRFPYDIHRELKPQLTLAIDINPFLLLTAQKILKGETLPFVEFPTAPIALDQAVVYQELKAPQPTDENFHLLFADAINLPLADQSLNSVITPWFIDIIPEDMGNLAKRINRTLKTEGIWYNTGPLGHNLRTSTKAYLKEEIEEILSDSGFKVLETRVDNVDYNLSPHSSQNRREKVFSFKAQKVKGTKEPKEYGYLPPWLQDLHQPIPFTELMAELRFKNELYVNLLAMVDGKNSFNNLVTTMVGQFEMDEASAKEALMTFLTNVYEKNINFF